MNSERRLSLSKKKPKKSNQGKKQHSDQRSSVSLAPVFEKQFKEDIRWWAKNNKKIYDKVFELIEDILDGNPLTGKGHPEPLKYMNYSGVWSRHINQEHRLVYRVHNQKIYFLQVRYHYD